ncbi:MAG: TonB C-terminal domain-containing protein [Acidobacteriota bacterium]|nr:TonB C-terminal domain-containing protein [Acidobacteriota bacterium]
MIERILVPLDARLPSGDVTATLRRRPTTMDARILVPAMLPIVALNGHSNIPSNLPLDSIAARVVVPRDIAREAYSVVEDISIPLQVTEMDQRIAVPQNAEPPQPSPSRQLVDTELVNPDVFMTGEVHLIPTAPSPEKARAELITRISSVALHVLLVAAILLQARLFPTHEPTAQEVDLARKQLTLLLPPGAFESSKPTAKPAPRPQPMHVDPRVLKKVAPPIATPPPTPAPTPQPERPAKELPSSPVPQPRAVAPEPQTTAPAPKVENPKPGLKLEAPDTPQPRRELQLPQNSPSRSIQDSLREAARNPNAGGRAGGVIGPMPRSEPSPGGAGGGGQGAGTYGNGYEILTPTEGVDFSDYMARVVASVRRNWYAVMPESAMLGDRGRVALQFRIVRDGSVPTGEPTRLIGSGKEPLDRAAVSAIRSSNPFEPLPRAFSGPYIELRFYFLYNLPLEAAYQ